MANLRCIKGVEIKNALKYLTDKFGPDALQKITEQLEPDDKAVFSKPILTSTWVPEKTYNNLLASADKIFGKGDYAMCFDIGRHNASEEIKLYSVFIRMGNPGFLLTIAASFWNQIHNSGNLIVVEKTPKSVIAHLKDFYEPSSRGNPAGCYATRGYFHEIFERTGAKNVRVDEAQCAALGAPYCVFSRP